MSNSCPFMAQKKRLPAQLFTLTAPINALVHRNDGSIARNIRTVNWGSAAAAGQGYSPLTGLIFLPLIFPQPLAVKDIKKNPSRFSQNELLYRSVSSKISQNQELSQITKLNRNKKCQTN